MQAAPAYYPNSDTPSTYCQREAKDENTDRSDCDRFTRGVLAEKRCRERWARGIHPHDRPRKLAPETDTVTTQEAYPVVLRKVAKAGVLEVMRSLGIEALTTTRIIRTGL